MIITCPSCATRYMADSATFQPSGRQVRCANCEHSWFQEPPEDYALEALPAPANYAATDVIDDAGHDTGRRAEQSADSAHRALEMGRFAGWGVLVLIMALLAYGGTSYSEQIVRFWPQSATLYGLFGKEVNTMGIDIRNYSYHYEIQDGTTVLVIEGEVVNLTDEPKLLPLFQVSLRDAGQRPILDWVFQTDLRELEPHQASPFVTHTDNPPERAHDIWIGVADVTLDTMSMEDNP